MTPVPQCTDELTPSRLKEVLALPDCQAEEAIFNRIQAVTRTWEMSYAEVGLLCRAVDSYLLWEQRTDPDTGELCASFSRWMHIAAPRSFSTCYAAMRDVEALQDVPAEQVAQIPAANFPVMKQLSTEVRNDPAVLRTAQTGSAERLVDHVRANHPDQHIERTKFLRFPLEESAAERIEEALRLAELHGAHNRSEALELIAREAVEQWRLEDEVAEALSREEPSCSGSK